MKLKKVVALTLTAGMVASLPPAEVIQQIQRIQQLLQAQQRRLTQRKQQNLQRPLKENRFYLYLHGTMILLHSFP